MRTPSAAATVHATIEGRTAALSPRPRRSAIGANTEIAIPAQGRPSEDLASTALAARMRLRHGRKGSGSLTAAGRMVDEERADEGPRQSRFSCHLKAPHFKDLFC